MPPEPTPNPTPDPKPDPTPDPKPDPTVEKPPWEKTGEPFDPERAWGLIEKLRGEKKLTTAERDELAKKVKEAEDADKTEAQRLTDAKAEAEKERDDAKGTALRLDVALDKAPEGMSVAQVRKLAKRLSGGSREELEADAEELFAEFAPSKDDPEPGRRPKERLRPGAAPSSEPEETDPAKLAATVPRM